LRVDNEGWHGGDRRLRVNLKIALGLQSVVPAGLELGADVDVDNKHVVEDSGDDDGEGEFAVTVLVLVL
jgi:hypothetical protein